MTTLRLIIVLVIAALANDGRALSLNGAWTLTVENYETANPIAATVPGGIYTDLSNAKLIPENLRGSNDLTNRWVGNRSVSYTRLFEVDKNVLEAPKVLLIFHGLDTFASVSVNDHEVGTTSNMFVRYAFDVKDHLKIGSNHLNVTFASAIKVAKDLYEKQAANYTVPPKCVPREYNGECHVNHIRKMQASFGWDWGPAFPSAGIWKSVELLPIKDATIFDLSVDVDDREDNWEVNATIVFALGSRLQDKVVSGSLIMELDAGNNRNFHTSKEISLLSTETYLTHTMLLKIPKGQVDTWWPNGYGKQSLYVLRVQLHTSSGSTEKMKRVGFRKVELVQDLLKKGRTFYFRINGVPIFAKGSNWIPASVFPELTSHETTVRHLLDSSRDAHMNMLRVWGGGVYESDFFYDLADEHGIMIWQDMMFACSMYPTTPEFLDSVRLEVAQNVARLKHHPSVVLWAGNNENEAALYGNWYGTGKADIYKEDYVKLYARLLKTEVEALDTTRPFVVSSPSDGLLTDESGFVGPDPYSNLYGDVHYYNYLRNGWDINQYPVTRFASEYGFQSIPSNETLAGAIEKIEDLQVDSEFLKHRQHLPAGWISLKLLIGKNFAIPRSEDPHRDFTDYVYLSQINQAVSTKTETESYRQLRSSLNDIGEGYTMGALYWQLNDVWQAPSWSSIEFSGRWKMLHYFAVDFFAPVIVTPRVSQSNDLTVYIVSDKLSPISGASLSINIYQWNSKSRPLFSKIYPNVTIAANAAQIVDTFWLDQFLVEASCGADSGVAKKNCLVELVLQDEKKQLIAPLNYVYPAPLKDVVLPSASIKFHVDSTPVPGKLANYLDYKIKLMSEEIALFVWLEAPGLQGRFSENGFHIIGAEKIVTFYANEAVTTDELSRVLKITTLSDLYLPNR